MLDTLEQALDKAREMATQAEQGDWEQVISLQTEYSALLATVPGELPPAFRDKAITLTEEIRAAEASVLTRASERQTELVKLMRSQSNAQKATSAYNANTGVRKEFSL